MKTFFDPRQRAHDPQFFMANGVRQPSPEQPARVDALLAGLQSLKLAPEAPPDRGLGPIAAVHGAEYLTFLKTIHDRWQRIPGAGPEVVPNIHPDRREAGYPRSAVGQAGYHQADTACPIGPATWDAAYLSAQCAVAATEAVLAGAKAAYALCRPPGHHAFTDLAGGFCFLNNAAVAAEALTTAGRRVAILDIDVHHGNGTQGIFYARRDVLTVSLHADPVRFYPFFWGHADERGEREGLGANLNLPLPRGTDDEAYLDALERALERVAMHAPDVLVVALGLDAHEGDPFKGFAVTTSGFGRIGSRIAKAGLPLVLIQEGGYLSAALGSNLAHVLGAVMEG